MKAFLQTGGNFFFVCVADIITHTVNDFVLYTLDGANPVATLSRSKTMPGNITSPTAPRKLNSVNIDRIKNAKELAEKAIKVS